MSEKKIIRVLAVDDHELMRKGIRFSLLAYDDIELIAEARSGREAVDLCTELKPDLVLMDMMLNGEMDGIATIQAIKERSPETPVLALSSFFERDLVDGAMQAGAVGYQVKDGSVDELANAIRAASTGQTTLASEAARVLFETPSKKQTLGFDLTEQEQNVLDLMVEGLSNPQIAECMYLSVAAVKYHVSGILSKLGADNRTMAAKIALENDLVSKD